MSQEMQNVDNNLLLCENSIQKIDNQFDEIKRQGFDTNYLFNPKLTEQEQNKYNQFTPLYNNKGEKRFFGKSFLFSPAINLNDWGVTLDSIGKNIYSFMHQPVVLTPDFRHPDNGLTYDTLENTLNYQEKFRIGEIIDIVYKQKDKAYFAIWELTDKKAIEMFQKYEMPMFVSPAIGHNENTIRKSNWMGLHLAIVKSPAFTTQKAIISGTCSGSKELCMIQLSTASNEVKELSVEKEVKPYETNFNFDKERVLNAYHENIKKLVNHNIINFNTQNGKKEIIKMDNNANATLQTTQMSQNDNVADKQRSPVTQGIYFDLNMCVANFVERGLDPNTAREICVTAGASDQGMGSQGQQAGQGNPSRGANPNAGVYASEEYLKFGVLLQNKNNIINQLTNKLSVYETGFKNKTGFSLDDETAMDTIKRLYDEDVARKAEALSNEYVTFLKLYEENENEVKALAKIYQESKVPIDKVKELYAHRKPLEENSKKEDVTQKQTEASNNNNNKEQKPHEMFNKMKDGNYSADTQDNRLIQKATASTETSVNSSPSMNLLYNMFEPKFNEHTSNKEKEDEL